MRVKMTVEIYGENAWSPVMHHTRTSTAITGDREVINVVGWESLARGLVKQAFHEFGEEDVVDVDDDEEVNAVVLPGAVDLADGG